MPLPLALAPVAGVALRYGTVALAAWVVSRRTAGARRDQGAEDALDRLDEGLSARRDAEARSVSLRLRRVFRRTAGGAGIEIDLAAMARFRMRRV
jgi:hypothetical protein